MLGEMKAMKINTKRAMTLIEVLIAALIFSLVLGTILGSLEAIVDFLDYTRDSSQSTADLKNMMERLRATPFDSLTTKFTNGVTDGPGSNLYTTIVGGYTLRNEHITVSYVNPNVDPLEIKVTNAWQDKKGHSYNASTVTFRTR